MDFLRRWRVALAVGGIVTIGVVALLIRWGETTRHTPNFGDLPTWLTFLAAAVGIPFAAYQFLAQRRELAEQQKAITEEFARQQKRDELLDQQLAQVHAASDVLMRAQAEKVDLKFDSWATDASEVDEVGDSVSGWPVHMARVANNSGRPIRPASCTLVDELEESQAQQVGRHIVYTESPELSQLVFAGVRRRLMDAVAGNAVEVIRAGDEYGFVFTAPAEAPVRISVRFTDDAGVQWQIDHDLHLERMPDEAE